MTFRFHTDALQEYENSTLYYLDISPQLAKSFVDDIEKSIKRIQRNPRAWGIVDEDVRRYLVKRFPFGIYFTIEADHFLIVAVMHLSRQPGYWKERITKITDQNIVIPEVVIGNPVLGLKPYPR